ncbi:FecR domain-containing protein [Delftia sp. HK171]|uniref:FecR family protein n=1 Tax=Delftia sp. HK171 TaxID=1920191 RepID=UPI001151C2E5|nr:FecR family protein [Delftia sp. HK171]TQL81179.1 FecR family protein [Delftia sp. HK171]
MKKSLWSLVYFFLFYQPTSAWADGHIALIKGVRGSVQISREGKAFEAASNTTLRIDDRVLVASNATAAIVFKDGTLLTLGGNADIKIRNYLFEPITDKYSFSVYMAKGSAIYESGKIAKLAPGAVQVTTPTATVGVRGTRFLIESN